MEHLVVEDLLLIADMIGAAAVRDIGLLDAAAHRPRATAFGQEAYPTIHQKAAALLDAIVRNHALVDGNKRLGWAAAVVFYDLNGFDLNPPGVDEAVELVVAVAAGHLELEKLAEQLASWVVGPVLRWDQGPGPRSPSRSRARRNTLSSIGSATPLRLGEAGVGEVGQHRPAPQPKHLGQHLGRPPIVARFQ